MEGAVLNSTLCRKNASLEKERRLFCQFRLQPWAEKPTALELFGALLL